MLAVVREYSAAGENTQEEADQGDYVASLSFQGQFTSLSLPLAFARLCGNSLAVQFTVSHSRDVVHTRVCSARPVDHAHPRRAKETRG